MWTGTIADVLGLLQIEVKRVHCRNGKSLRTILRRVVVRFAESFWGHANVSNWPMAVFDPEPNFTKEERVLSAQSVQVPCNGPGALKIEFTKYR